MKIRTGFLIFLIIFYFSIAVDAQKREIKFDHYDISIGLSHNTVHCITQDKNGFLWIGTEDGLNMFDGYTFTTFKKNTEDPFSISDNFIYSLYEDKKNNLWIGTNNKGVNKYNKLTGQFISYQTFTLNGKKELNSFVNDITEDSKGNIWLGTSNGLFKFDSDSEKIVAHYDRTNSSLKLSDNDIQSLYMDTNDVLWIGTYNRGLNRFDIKKNTIQYFQNIPYDTSSLSNNGVKAIYRDKSGNLWIGTNLGLNVLDEKSGEFKRFVNDPKNPNSLSDNIVFCIYEDHHKNLWIGTENGLNLFDRKNNIFYNWKSDPVNSSSLSDNQVSSIFEDKYGQVWVGTATKGLNKFNNNLKNFKHFHNDPLNANSLSNNKVREIYQDGSGLIWIGVANGLNVYDPKNMQFQHLQHNPSDPQSISQFGTSSVLKDSKKNIWIGTWAGGLDKGIYDKGKYKFEHFTRDLNNPTTIASNIVQEIVEDRWGRIWLGTDEGLDLFDVEKKQALHHDLNNANSFVQNKIQSGCIVFDKADNIWLGTWGGLLKVILSPTTHLPVKILQYQLNDTAKFSLNDSRVIAMHLDNKNNLWLGTYGGGLNKITLDNNCEIKSIKYYTEKDGLPNNVIYAILEDDKGFLWLSTNNGLSKFDPANGKFENYDDKDGLQSNQFHWGAACKLKSGELAFGGINGFNSFFPDSIYVDNIIPDMVITDFKIFNQKVAISPNSKLTKNIIYTDLINLDYDDKVISFEFSALQFADPDKNKYAYKLDGFDKDWIYADAKKRFAIYTNLDPGKYTFMVKGSNADGVWNEKSTNIKINIKPPFWQTWWFLSLVIFATLSILYLIYNYRINHLLKIEQMRNRIATYLHDDIGSTLSSISILSDILGLQLQENPKQLEMIKKIGCNALNMMDSMDDIIWAVNSANDEFQNLTLRIKEYAIPLFEIKGIDYAFNIPGTINDVKLKMEMRNNLYLITKEAINNLLKYSGCTYVEIIFSFTKPYLVLIISDNGKGFDLKMGTSRNGLRNMKNRAKQINTVLDLKSSPGKGTQIKLNVKI